MKQVWWTAIAIALNVSCKSDGPQSLAPAPAATHFNTVLVEAKAMPKMLPLTGSLVANQQADVAANASGRVMKTYVERGSLVKAEQPLCQLDVRSAALSEQEARANFQVAKAQRQLAQTQCTRNEELFNKGAISKDEWDRFKSVCETSSGSSMAAEARADLAIKTINDSTVRAPFAGMVGERFVSVGEYVQASSRVVTLVEVQTLRLQLTVSEADVGHIKSGQEVSFDVQSYPGQTFTGKVAYIGPALRSSSRDLVMEARVPNPDNKLRPGMFATAHLHLEDQALPVVPKSALLHQENTHHAFVLVDGHLEERIVQIGPERDGYVAILDGIQVGESVVAEMTKDVRDGVAVN